MLKADLTTELVRFNSQRDGILHFYDWLEELSGERFNSQRDGILPKREIKPNDKIGFNSQRDGILLKIINEIITIELFQFPTGWNSTKVTDRIVVYLDVSIPNGMEFY